MPEIDGQKDYVSWGDVADHVRWLERGYGLRVFFKATVASPKGEQDVKWYWEAYLADDKGNPVALSNRALGRFPNSTSKTVPGLFLGMLFALDNIAQKERIWTEPTLDTRRERAPH